VILIGVSVALLPAASGSAASAPPTASMPDCDHQMHVPADKTQKSDSDCISMANCVFHCFSVTCVAAVAVAFVPVVGAELQPSRVSDRLSPQLGSLPFRPPRT
jgi:hypothetical protein